MSIVVDHTSIGSVAADSSASSIPLTTTSAVSSGGFVVLMFGWYDTGSSTLTGVSDNSGSPLTYTIDKQAVDSSNSAHLAIVRAQAPSGLPSGTVITGALSSAAMGGRAAAGISFTGVATSSPVDGTPPALQNIVSSSAWTSGSVALSAGSVLVALTYEFNTDMTSTPTSPSIEIFDVNGGPGSFGASGAYRIEPSAGSYSVAGTWSSTTDGATIAVPYLAATGGGSTDKPVSDSFTVSDASAVTQAYSTTDSGTLTDSSSLSSDTSKVASDSATLTDSSILGLPLSTSDSGTLSETSTVEAQTAGSEGTLSESSVVGLTGSDSGALTDSSSVSTDSSKAGSDAASVSEASNITIDAALSDAFTTSDASALRQDKSASDTLSLSVEFSTTGGVLPPPALRLPLSVDVTSNVATVAVTPNTKTVTVTPNVATVEVG